MVSDLQTLFNIPVETLLTRFVWMSKPSVFSKVTEIDVYLPCLEGKEFCR